MFLLQPSTTRNSSPVKLEPPTTAVVKQEEMSSSEEIAQTPLKSTADPNLQTESNMSQVSKAMPKTVTPPEVNIKDEKPEDDSTEKQVRFGKNQVKSEESTKPSHPGSLADSYTKSSSPRGAVLQFKTYRSPSRKRDEEVPSLCSTNSDPAPIEKSSKSGVPTSSISVDPSQSTTSPLASHEGEKSEKDTSHRADRDEIDVSMVVDSRREI